LLIPPILKIIEFPFKQNHIAQTGGQQANE